MNRLDRYRAIRAAVLVATLMGTYLSAVSQAYKVRPLIRPRPNDTHINSLSIAASPVLVSFALVAGGTAHGSSGVTVITTWTSNGNVPALSLYGYFNSSTNALSDGLTPPHLIPSSAVLGSMTTGIPTSYTPFTQSTGFGGAGAGLTLLNTVAGEISRDGTRADVLNLEINLAGVPKLPAGVYTGTLTLQASMQ